MKTEDVGSHLGSGNPQNRDTPRRGLPTAEPVNAGNCVASGEAGATVRRAGLVLNGASVLSAESAATLLAAHFELPGAADRGFQVPLGFPSKQLLYFSGVSD
jgi:hypothetical protein